MNKIVLLSQTFYSDIKPSVNAQQFITAGASNNGLHTGQISLNIPLFNLQGKGLDIPISISYNAVGISHVSEASCIGLGWSLLSGGVITQTIRGKNDLKENKRHPWFYNVSYLQSIQEEQNRNPLYPKNRFDYAMESVKTNGEPDLFNYSFLGYSGDICLEYLTDGSSVWTMYPNKSFKIEKTTSGFRIITDRGIECLFEESEKKYSGGEASITSWFLTKIRTPEGGIFTFQYANDYSYDLTRMISQSVYDTDQSKRITRIDYDYGYLIFTSSHRGDKEYSMDKTIESKKITDIVWYNKKGELIKGFQFDNNSYFYNNIRANETYADSRLKLDGIREYNHQGVFLPYYRFEYDYKFYLPKTSVRIGDLYPLERTKGTWACNPSTVTSVDRDQYGKPSPSKYCYDYTPDGTCMWALDGFYSEVDPVDGYGISDYLCLTKIIFPSGGSETYYYENHDYDFYSNNQEKLPNNMNKSISGKRIYKKEIRDNKGSIETFFYKYLLHDENYRLTSTSSGILVNPAIHTTTQYSVGDSKNGRQLLASPHKTLSPQNSIVGSPVYYFEVEETQVEESGNVYGKRIYFFEKMYALPAVNYVYLNYGINTGGNDNLLINIPNTFYGKQNYRIPELEGLSSSYFTYLAYPLGRFTFSHLREGKLIKEIILDSNGNMIKKTENLFTQGYGVEKTQFGLLIENFIDGDNKNRYLISQTRIEFGIRELIKQTITHYYQNDSITEQKAYIYTNLNLIKSESSTSGPSKLRVKEYVYPNDVVFQTSSNLSPQASSIKKMKELNMIAVPLQTTLKNGNEYIEGTYNTYKQLSESLVAIDTIFRLELKKGSVISHPLVNANGIIVKNSSFKPDKIFTTYDANGNPTTIIRRDGLKETIVWGYGGKYPIAGIKNYSEAQLRSNSIVLSQLSFLENFSEISDDERTDLNICNQTIRSNLPKDVIITTYTYSPLIGMTSLTDEAGKTTYYEYDSFGRLKLIRDHDGKLVEQYGYHYKR